MFGGTPPTHLMWSSMFRPDSPQVKKAVQWHRIAKLFAPYRRQESSLLGCLLVNSVLGLVPPLLTRQVIDSAIPGHSFSQLAQLVFLMIGSAVFSALIGVYQGYLNAQIAEGILRDLRTDLYSHLHRLPLPFFTGTKTGEIMNRVSNDVDNVDDVISGTIATIVSNVLILLTTCVAVLILDWRLALLALLVVPVMIYPMWPVGRKMYEIRKFTRSKRDEIESLNQETLSVSGMTLVKSFVRENYERERFYQASTDLMKTEIRLAMVGRWFMMTVSAMVVIGPSIVWLGGGWMAIQQTLTVGTIVSFVALLGRLYMPASTLAGVQVQIVSALAVFERIFEYLDMPGEEPEDSAGELTQVAGEVAFHEVYFSYAPERPAALADISFTVASGQLAAFVGKSGAGKTTVMNLLARFYESDRGRITIDGRDITEVTLASLRHHIGIVTQETYLFHDTIYNNLLYGKLDARRSEVEKAASAANIHDFIVKLPDGYDTVIGERGHKLSGGERQRLAIARVLLKDPKILILDEATSSLDSLNESLIQSALVPLMANRTSLVIAHRLSTIVAADVIFVLEDGRLIEEGTHSQLLDKGDAYARLYHQQFRRDNIG